MRRFWSYERHRLFVWVVAQIFLVYGVCPGEWAERKLLGQDPREEADVGEVFGGDLSNAVVHSLSVGSVLSRD